MTLAEELMRQPAPAIQSRGYFVDLSWQRLRLPFDGRLSEEERRLMYDGFGDRGTDYEVLELEGGG